MGSVGRKRNTSVSRETVTDDYGRTYNVVSQNDIPDGYSLWTSGTWRGANADFNNGYAVFANIQNNNVDTDNGVVVRVSGEDAEALMGLDASHATSASVERYINRYDRDNVGGYVKRRVARFKRALDVLRRLGI